MKLIPEEEVQKSLKIEFEPNELMALAAITRHIGGDCSNRRVFDRLGELLRVNGYTPSVYSGRIVSHGSLNLK